MNKSSSDNREAMAVKALNALAEKRAVKISTLAKNAGMHHTNLTRNPEKIKYATLTKVFQKNGYDSYEDFILEEMNMKETRLRESEIALVDMFKALFRLIEEDKPIKKTDLLRQIIHLGDAYSRNGQKNAQLVMKLLEEFANAEPREPSTQATQSLSRRAPVGSA